MGASPYQVGERRPIAARNLKVFQRLASWLARRGASPNGISLAGMALGLAAGVALAATPWLPFPADRAAWVLAALFIQLRLLANMLDGMVAIEARRSSPVGELYNEVPDRVSDAAVLIGAGYAVGGDPVLGYAAACAAVFTAYIRSMGKAAGTLQDFSGPMAKQQRMFVITLAALYCGLAPSAWQPGWGPAGSWGVSAAALALVIAGALLTAGRRLAHIAAMLRTRTDGPTKP
jgi:phosphatidylglycerophosphate synthase